jgi:hypothetical protein
LLVHKNLFDTVNIERTVEEEYQVYICESVASTAVKLHVEEQNTSSWAGDNGVNAIIDEGKNGRFGRNA